MKADARIAFAALVGTRLPILLAGAIAVLTVGTLPPPLPSALWRLSQNELTNLLARWDTKFYYAIATEGYRWDPHVIAHQNVAFFPLYPLLMRWTGQLLGGHLLLGGAVVSLSCFTAAIALLYRLARLDLDDRQARAAILLLAAYPFAFYYSIDYSESLFLFVTVGAFYTMRRRQWLWTAVFGLAAGLTRPNGLWLTPCLLCFAFDPRVTVASHPYSPKTDSASALVSAALAALTPALGTVIHSTYLYFKVGDPLAWVAVQAAWGLPLLGRHGVGDPGWDLPQFHEVRTQYADAIVLAGNDAALALSVVAAWSIRRRWNIAYPLLIVFTIVPPFVTHLEMSIGRFSSVLFPVFFWLAVVIPRDRLMRVAAGFGALQLVLAALFFLWRPIF